MSHTAAKKRYKTTNWAQYNASLKARGSLTIWLDKRMTWFAATRGKRGRSPKFSDAAIQFCLTLKNLFGLALRQATGLVESVLQLSGLTWPTPDFSTLSRRQQTLNVQIPYTRSPAGFKAAPSCIAMQRLLPARGWAGGYGKFGAATTDEVWWKPR